MKWKIYRTGADRIFRFVLSIVCFSVLWLAVGTAFGIIGHVFYLIFSVIFFLFAITVSYLNLRIPMAKVYVSNNDLIWDNFSWRSIFGRPHQRVCVDDVVAVKAFRTKIADYSAEMPIKGSSRYDMRLCLSGKSFKNMGILFPGNRWQVRQFAQYLERVILSQAIKSEID